MSNSFSLICLTICIRIVFAVACLLSWLKGALPGTLPKQLRAKKNGLLSSWPYSPTYRPHGLLKITSGDTCHVRATVLPSRINLPILQEPLHAICQRGWANGEVRGDTQSDCINTPYQRCPRLAGWLPPPSTHASSYPSSRPPWWRNAHGRCRSRWSSPILHRYHRGVNSPSHTNCLLEHSPCPPQRNLQSRILACPPQLRLASSLWSRPGDQLCHWNTLAPNSVFQATHLVVFLPPCLGAFVLSNHSSHSPAFFKYPPPELQTNEGLTACVKQVANYLPSILVNQEEKLASARKSAADGYLSS